MAVISPVYLYYGIKVNIADFDKLALGDKPLVSLDKKDNMIHLTTNPYIARDNSNNGVEEGNILEKIETYKIAGVTKNVHLPMIGVTYDIETSGLPLQGPIQKDSPNDLENTEWLIESIPVDNYNVASVIIGADTLHYPVVIPFKDVTEIKKLVRKEIEKRERHLNDFISEIDKLPQRKRDDLTEDYINMFRTLVGEDGAKYISANDYKVNSVDTALKYLMSIYYANNTQRLDFNNLLAIEDFRKKLSGNNEIQDLLNLMYMEILSLENQKDSMVEVTDITGKKKNTDKIEITINGRKYMMSKVILKLLEDINAGLEDNPTDKKLLSRKEELEKQLDLISYEEKK